MSSLRHRLQSHRRAASNARALRRAMSTTASTAVRNEMLASIGR